MQFRPDEALALAAAELSGAAPHQWQRFVTAFAVYANHRRDELVRAPGDRILAAQGRAQESMGTYDLLHDCRAVAEEVMTNAQKRATKPVPPRPHAPTRV